MTDSGPKPGRAETGTGSVHEGHGDAAGGNRQIPRPVTPGNDTESLIERLEAGVTASGGIDLTADTVLAAAGYARSLQAQLAEMRSALEVWDGLSLVIDSAIRADQPAFAKNIDGVIHSTRAALTPKQEDAA